MSAKNGEGLASSIEAALITHGYVDIQGRRRLTLTISSRATDGTPLERKATILDLKSMKVLAEISSLPANLNVAAKSAAEQAVENHLPMQALRRQGATRKTTIPTSAFQWIPFKQGGDKGVKLVLATVVIYVANSLEWWITDPDGDMLHECLSPVENLETAKRMAVSQAADMRLI